VLVLELIMADKKLAYVAVTLISALVGCTRPADLSCQHGIMAVGDNDQTMVQYVFCHAGPRVAVWADISGRRPGSGSQTGSTTDSSSGAEWHSSVKAADGRSVALRVVTTDGKSWTLTVNGKECRLEDGALILVRTCDGLFKVTQLKQDLSGLPPTIETWRQLSKDRAEVKDFVDQAGAKE
jgi:hypothetical protein